MNADLDWADWNALRVLASEHARGLRARALLAEAEGAESTVAIARYEEAAKLDAKVLRQFNSASRED